MIFNRKGGYDTVKKTLLAVAMVVVCLSLVAYGTMAYFTAEDTATNVITAGNTRIALQESAVSEDGGDPIPFEDTIGVMPGTEVSKIVEVKNTGDKTAYIRIKLEKELTLAEGINGEIDLDLIGLNIDTESWTEKDGYYYYNEPLTAGQTSRPLFTAVTYSKEMNDLYQNGKTKITVKASAVQTDNNGDSALKAAGWPEA